MKAGVILLPVSYSTFNEHALGTYIGRHYSIGVPVRCNLIARGMNDTYIIETTDGKFVFRVYRNKWRSNDSEILFEIDLLNYLFNNNLNVSLPIKSTTNAYILKITAPEGERFGVLFTLVEGQPLRLDCTDTCYLFGEEAAKLHVISNSFQSDYKKAVMDMKFLIDQPLAIINRHLGRRPKDIQYLTSVGGYLKDRIMELDNLDWGICHGDLHGYNAHIHENKIAHFDFDLCGFGWRSYDLSVFKFTLDLSGDNEDKKAEQWAAFLNGYQNYKHLNENELKAIPIFVGVRRLWLMSLSLEYFRDLDITGSIDSEEKYLREELLGFEVVINNLKRL